MSDKNRVDLKNQGIKLESGSENFSSKKTSGISFSGKVNTKNILKLSLCLRISKLIFEFKLTWWWLLVVPSMCSLILSLSLMFLFRTLEEITLPSIALFNFVNALFFILGGLLISCFSWTLKQRFLFEQACQLVFNKTKLKHLMGAKNPSLTKYFKSDVILLWTFFILLLYVATMTKWTTAEPNGIVLGNFDCKSPSYKRASVKNHIFEPLKLSGTINIQEIYKYGMPTKDGIVTGFGPLPFESSLEDFVIVGEGPVVTFTVYCQLDPEPYHGQNFTLDGSGSQIKSFHRGNLSFNASIEIFLPVSGFKPGDKGVATAWTKQLCLVEAIPGWGTWYFHYLKHEKNLLTGKAVALELNSISSLSQENSVDIETEDVNKVLISTISSEERKEQYKIIIEGMENAFNATLNNVWYEASKGKTFSNIMSWATEQDGYYYGHLTGRGLKGALGAMSQDLYLQHKNSRVSKCTFLGSEESGSLHLDSYIVTIINSCLVIITFFLVGGNVFSLLENPIKDKELFRSGILNVNHEERRFFNSSIWGNTLSSKNYVSTLDKDQLIEKLLNTNVRFGNKMTFKGRVQQMIGPDNFVRKINDHDINSTQDNQGSITNSIECKTSDTLGGYTDIKNNGNRNEKCDREQFTCNTK
jgi:hypothetical protein